MTAVDVLIIGSGPAGLTAGLYAARAGAKTVIIENMVAGGQINFTPEIENFPGFVKVGGAELGEKMREQAEQADVEIIYDEVESVDVENRVLRGSEGEYGYKTLILATGARPRMTGAENEDNYVGAGVHFCGLCDGAFYKDKDIVVVGGGNHAVEEAIYLSDIAKSITMVVDVKELTAQEALVKQLGKDIKIHYGVKLKSIDGDKKLTGVTLDSGVQIKCDGVFVAIGRIPNTELFKDILDTARGGFVITDSGMRTSAPRIYACGDMIQKEIRQIVTACADGAIAGINAACESKNN